MSACLYACVCALAPPSPIQPPTHWSKRHRRTRWTAKMGVCACVSVCALVCVCGSSAGSRCRVALSSPVPVSRPHVSHACRSYVAPLTVPSAAQGTMELEGPGAAHPPTEPPERASPLLAQAEPPGQGGAPGAGQGTDAAPAPQNAPKEDRKVSETVRE